MHAILSTADTYEIKVGMSIGFIQLSYDIYCIEASNRNAQSQKKDWK